MIAPLHNASQIEWLEERIARVDILVSDLRTRAEYIMLDEYSHPEIALDAGEIHAALDQIDEILRDLSNRRNGKEA